MSAGGQTRWFTGTNAERLAASLLPLHPGDFWVETDAPFGVYNVGYVGAAKTWKLAGSSSAFTSPITVTTTTAGPAITGTVGDGTGTAGAAMLGVVNDGNVASVSIGLRLSHTVTGAAGGGVGIGIEFINPNLAGTQLPSGQVLSSFTTVGAGSENGRLSFWVREAPLFAELARVEGGGAGGFQMLDGNGAVGFGFRKVVGAAGEGAPIVRMTDASGTPGAVIINRPAGKAAIPALAVSVLVTNNLVTPASIIQVQLEGAFDATLTNVTVTPNAGSFLILGNAPATGPGAVVVSFVVMNPAP